jgi:glycosyltransferase involved in cell wall biosynthesis
MEKPSINPPSISVVLSTRNRGDRILPTVVSVLLNQIPTFELIIVDQNDGEETALVLRQFQGDSRLRLIRSASRGLSAGRNAGIAVARAEIIACTDDDCEVSLDWLPKLQDAFASHPEAALVFGNVLPGPHDSTAGFIPAYVRHDACLAKGIRQKHRVEGIAACMGLRRCVWEELHGFDVQLGAGAMFHAAEEMDFTIRVLLAGHCIFETPNVAVVHHGFRTWNQGTKLVDGYYFGNGAMFAKHIKCGNWSVLAYLGAQLRNWVGGQPGVNLGRRPPRRQRLRAFICGLLAGFRQPVNRAQSLYTRGVSRSLRATIPL